jgi:hypothetical protein
MKGWHDASVVFVISFYAIPVFAAWYYLERYFPAKKFERVGSYIQTLGSIRTNASRIEAPLSSRDVSP